MKRWQHCGPPSKLQGFYEKHSSHVLTSRGLRQQCRLFRGTGGASEDIVMQDLYPHFSTEPLAIFIVPPMQTDVTLLYMF